MESSLNKLEQILFYVDIYSAPSHILAQPNCRNPSRSYKDGEKTKFNADWYSMYRCLEYSIERLLIYCLACQNLSTDYTHLNN